jgi:hypothetical protein
VDVFRGISAAAGHAPELVAELGAAVATEAHLGQLPEVPVHGRHSQRPCWAGSARRGRPCSHIAPSPGRRATLAQAAGTTGYRLWEAGCTTVDCVSVTRPMDLRRREDPSRGQSSPWQ